MDKEWKFNSDREGYLKKKKKREGYFRETLESRVLWNYTHRTESLATLVFTGKVIMISKEYNFRNFWKLGS